MDLSKLSTEDLVALKSGDLSNVSTEGLMLLKGKEVGAGGTAEPSFAESLAANPITRFATGAAKPFLGAAEWLPGSLGRAAAENNRILRQMEEAGNVGKGEFGQLISGAAGLGGEVLSPAFLKAASILPTAKTLGQVALQGAGIGGIAGATAPIGSADVSEKLASTAGGAVAGGMLTPVVGKVLGGISNVVAPVFSQGAVDRSVGKLAAKAAGERADDVAAALSSAQPGQTAAQAALPAGSSEFAALQSLMKGNKGTEFGDVARTQEAARMAALKAVTPDLKAAEAARDAAARANYDAAFNVVVKADPQLAQMASNPYFAQAQKEISTLLESKGVSFKTEPVKYLHYIKLGFDKMLQKTGDTALSNAEKAEVAKLKDSLVSWVGNKSKPYDFARTEFARMSGPVNQANVLEAMATVLEKPTGGERVTPFLNVLGAGEGALLKRTTGGARYGINDLSKVLTKDQLDVVTNIANQLKSGAELSSREVEGMKGALQAIRASESKDVRGPALINYKIAMINNLLNRLEGIGGEKIERRAAELMLPGKSNELAKLMMQYQANPQGLLSQAARYQGGPIESLVGAGMFKRDQ